MGRTAKYILLGQISLFVFLIICLLLNPHFLLETNEGGVSNYGLHLKTIIPYTLAFGLAGIFTLLGAKSLSDRPLRIILYILGVLYLAVLVSTYFYKISTALDHVHEYASALLFIVELILGTWFGLWVARNTVAFLGLAVQYLGFILGILNDFGVIHKLFIAEMVASLGFSIVLVTTVHNEEQAKL